MVVAMHKPWFVYSTATEKGSTMHTGFINALSISPLKQVSFQCPTDVPIPLKEISTTNNDISKAIARKSSIVSLSELKLIHYKLAVAFGICCIVVLFMLPVIFYYVEGGSKFNDYSPNMGIGIVNVSQVYSICMCVYIIYTV